MPPRFDAPGRISIRSPRAPEKPLGWRTFQQNTMQTMSRKGTGTLVERISHFDVLRKMILNGMQCVQEEDSRLAGE